jgi:hypothetical protein
MKLAVCFYGQPRYYKFGYQSTEKLYKNCNIDYYMHSWGNENDYTDLSSFFDTKNIIVENQVNKFKRINCDFDMSRTTKELFITLSPLYSMQKLHGLIEESKEEYDFWILTRTDIGTDGTFSLLDMNFDKNITYSSYVTGNEWLTKYIDTKFIMCSKENILNLTNIYSDIEEYICNKKIPMCHHHLFFNSLLKSGDKMEMIIGNPNDSFFGYQNYCGGWRWIRNNELSIT